jgi:hypothetical protein
MADAVLAFVDSQPQVYVDRLAEAVAIPSVSGDAAK